MVGLPRCDFVFSSTRTSFIGYGFATSALETTILRTLLADRGIEAVEAGGSLAPGQNAFCAKICSKIIVSQFCIILMNNDLKDGAEIPNANVNMEYGLMLGFNKYIIPFQRESQTLPFNVAGLDTVKYTNENFPQKAAQAIDVAIVATRQDTVATVSPDQTLAEFLLTKGLLVVALSNDGDRALSDLGRPLGYGLLSTFDGMRYVYFGNFTTLRPEIVLWRLRTFEQILQGRLDSLPARVAMGVDPKILALTKTILSGIQIMLLVTSDEARTVIRNEIAARKSAWPVEVFSLGDVAAGLGVVR